jgi:hypothetical protein
MPRKTRNTRRRVSGGGFWSLFGFGDDEEEKTGVSATTPAVNASGISPSAEASASVSGVPATGGRRKTHRKHRKSPKVRKTRMVRKSRKSRKSRKNH